MSKKIIFLIVFILILVVGGGFFWWRNQKDVRELNKNLPEGVKVMKNLKGEYWVVNKIDGYEFRVPKEWKGLEEIEYVSEWVEKGYKGRSINLKGREGVSRIAAIDKYKIEKTDINLESWTRNIFEAFGLVGVFSKDKVGEFEIVKTREEAHLSGMYVYFFKAPSGIYAITCGSEKFIREIIINGRW